MNEWFTFLAGAILIAVVFFISWLWAVRCNNYSLVDAVWAFGIGLISSLWLLMKGDFSLKCWIAMALIAAWSLRLGIHLERRVKRMHPNEDARYAKLREVWTGRERSAFFWFFQGQAVSVILLALPFLVIALDKDWTWSLWESCGLAISLIGILGESLADAQMSHFKSRNQDSSAVCQDGLWRYSRHPNYFFEAIIWVGFYIYACGSEWGWMMIYAPAMIIYLLLWVTGIPPTEAAAILRKGDAYRRYQATTSPFIPWLPKKH
jgi:steroid 5-alpha reductase family enzyme